MSLLGTRVPGVAVLVAWVLVELALVDLVQLGTSERIRGRVNCCAESVLRRIDVGEKAGQDIGQLLNEKLCSITHQIVPRSLLALWTLR